MVNIEIPTIQLNNGVTMPQLGLGVWQAKDGEEVERAVHTAFDAGYRLIDTAAMYKNEEGVGRAIRGSDIPREEIFVTTKLWNRDHGYDRTLRAFDASLQRLNLDYIDLYLIHWPMPRKGTIAETWRAFEKLLADGRVRAIGVSNFKPEHLEELLKTVNIPPAVNQIELHPRMQQPETRTFCRQHNIQIEAWSPLMRASDILEDPLITKLADSHDKTPAQIILRWHLQNDVVAIPKSVTPERIRENIDIFDFELSASDMTAINAMDRNQRIGPDPSDFYMI
jgi:2,5-diketo-D-gluconate reductase A